MMNNNRALFRVGIGSDVHRLVPGRKLILGGVNIPSEVGLLGHSDADVLLHAISDALLGSLALGDIGKHFPDSESRFRDMSSLRILEKTVRIIRKKGYGIVNVDSTVFAQKPRLSPYREEMETNIADVAGLSKDAVSVKFKTTEGLGYVGAGEGMAANAAVLICEDTGARPVRDDFV